MHDSIYLNVWKCEVTFDRKYLNDYLAGRGGNGGGRERGNYKWVEENLGVMDMFIILLVVMVSHVPQLSKLYNLGICIYTWNKALKRKQHEKWWTHYDPEEPITSECKIINWIYMYPTYYIIDKSTKCNSFKLIHIAYHSWKSFSFSKHWYVCMPNEYISVY